MKVPKSRVEEGESLWKWWHHLVGTLGACPLEAWRRRQWKPRRLYWLKDGQENWINYYFTKEDKQMMNRCSGIFLSGYLPPAPARAWRDFFFPVFTVRNWWTYGGKTHKNISGSLWSFKLIRLAHKWPPVICQLQIKFPYLTTGFCGGFQLLSFYSVSWNLEFVQELRGNSCLQEGRTLFQHKGVNYNWNKKATVT